jgi:succinylarginine dihydrolase
MLRNETSGTLNQAERKMREILLTGLPGPTHNFSGLSPGNAAATASDGQESNPRKAALQVLDMMDRLAAAGAVQWIMPPQQRPHLATLRAAGFGGSDHEVLHAAVKNDPHLLRRCYSAAAMFTANAATVVPRTDTTDGRMHIVCANLQFLFHRSIESSITFQNLKQIFPDGDHYRIHEPLPSGGGLFGDEGDANHLRITTGRNPDGRDRAAHLFAWGRRGSEPLSAGEVGRYQARQTREASSALARLHQIDSRRALVLLPQQSPEGIAVGAFHSDLLATSAPGFLLIHEKAFADTRSVVARLNEEFDAELEIALVRETEFPLSEAIASYLFNSRLVEKRDGTLVMVVAKDHRPGSTSSSFANDIRNRYAGRISEVIECELGEALRNGGGPGCLTLRIPVNGDPAQFPTRARVLYTQELADELREIIVQGYREYLTTDTLFEPDFGIETISATNRIWQVLGTSLPHV